MPIEKNVTIDDLPAGEVEIEMEEKWFEMKEQSRS